MNQALALKTFNLTEFDKGNLIVLARECGLRRDWARTKTAEIRAMLLAVSFERLQKALSVGGLDAEQIDALMINAADFQAATEDDAADDVKDAAELADYLGDDIAVQAVPAVVAPVVATPPVATTGAPNVTKLAGLLAQILATGAVDAEQVGVIVQEKLDPFTIGVDNKLASFANLMLERQEAIMARIEKNTPHRIVVASAVGEVKLEGMAHPVFEKVLRLASAGLNVLLVGPAGCGKTHLAAQVAKSLGKSFASISGSAGVSEAQLVGRLLPTGNGGQFQYHESPFVREYIKDNGAFLLDELDAFDSNCLLAVNQATANGGFEIEARAASGLDTYVKRGASNLLLGSMNTYGTGADVQYVGRSQLDAATLDRWYIVPMSYNSALEAALSGMDAPAVKQWCAAVAPSAEEIRQVGAWVTALRTNADKARLRRIVSTRTLQKAIAARHAGVPFAEIKTDITAGWSKDELAKCAI